MTEMIVDLLVPIIGFAGAVLGTTYFAFLQFKKQRGFDRQLEWCESMMRAFNSAGAAITSATTGEPSERQEGCWTEAVYQYERLIPLCGLKDIYAHEEAIGMIDSFMTEYRKLIERHLELCRPGTPDTGCNGEVCLDELRKSADSLARLARRHLDLEPLPDTVDDSLPRFSRSLRNLDLGHHAVALDRPRPEEAT